MASLIPSTEPGTGSLLKDGNYVVYERPEPYGWTVAAKVPQDQVLNMGSTVRYTAVFLGAVFLALLCLYCHNYISLHLSQGCCIMEKNRASPAARRRQHGNQDIGID
ncbi:MAG: hypothetical protein ACLR0U_11260 [Enterocloster clostridioformis]